MRAQRWLFLLLTLVMTAAAWSASAGAQELLQAMDRAVAYMAKGLKDAGADPTAPRTKAVFTALKNVDANVARLAETFPGKDRAYFTALRETCVAVGELRSVYSQSGLKIPAVADGLARLEEAVDTFEENYSRFALRQRQGGALSDTEREHLAKLQQDNALLAAQLAKLESQVASDAALRNEVAALRAQARALARTQATLEAYLQALQDSERLEGRMRGLNYTVQNYNMGFVAYFVPVLPYAYTLGDFVWDASWFWRYGPGDWGYWDTWRVEVGRWDVYDPGFVQDYNRYDTYLDQSVTVTDVEGWDRTTDITDSSYVVDDVTAVEVPDTMVESIDMGTEPVYEDWDGGFDYSD
ncbi:MAG: hypothetical protein AB1758_26290 [Candidatus Eremiobacterota bacterium]